MFEYVKENYGVPAELGKVIKLNGKRGLIAEDRGHYIGVNFDDDKPGVISNVHPTDDNLIYMGDVALIRKMTRSQKRYQEYLRSECSESFGWYIKASY